MFGPWPGGGGGGGGGGQVNTVQAGIGVDVNAADPINPIVSLEAINARVYYPDQLIVPNSDFAIPAIAPTDQDNTTPTASACEYNATPENGRGWSSYFPAVPVTKYKIGLLGKPFTLPAGARVSGWKLYYRTFRPGAVSAWQSITLTDQDWAASLTPDLATQQITIGGGAGQLNAAQGDVVYFELTRIPKTGAGTELPGAVMLLAITEEWGN